jgi:uncharacterized protein DUF6220
MRKAFVVASTLLLLSFVLQFAFAAVGAFTKPAHDGSYVLHSVNGMAVIPALTVLTTVFAAMAKAPGRLIALAILPLGLVIVQVLLAALANSFTDAAGATTPVGLTIAGLHALNGIIAVHVVVSVTRAARRLGRPAEVAEGVPA